MIMGLNIVIRMSETTQRGHRGTTQRDGPNVIKLRFCAL